MEEIFKESNVISFHVPLTSETIYIADYQFFKSFSRPVWVLNISRGKVLKPKTWFEVSMKELFVEQLWMF